ncbi:hypothetical protein AB6D08_26085, partial [Vibrio splendidus]
HDLLIAKNQAPSMITGIFRMGGSDLSPVIVHEKIKRVIEKNMDGVNFFSVKDYRFGDEY